MLARLDARAYVSLSRERRLRINAASGGTDSQEAAGSTPAASTAPNPSSIFHTDMPGVMSIEDIKENISLDEIDVRLKDKIVNLAVRARSSFALLLIVLSCVSLRLGIR